VRKVNKIPENKELELASIDPKLDRLYREHAIAVALSSQIPQLQNNPEVEIEPERDLEPVDECSSTFADLE